MPAVPGARRRSRKPTYVKGAALQTSPTISGLVQTAAGPVLLTRFGHPNSPLLLSRLWLGGGALDPIASLERPPRPVTLALSRDVRRVGAVGRAPRPNPLVARPEAREPAPPFSEHRWPGAVPPREALQQLARGQREAGGAASCMLVMKSVLTLGVSTVASAVSEPGRARRRRPRLPGERGRRRASRLCGIACAATSACSRSGSVTPPGDEDREGRGSPPRTHRVGALKRLKPRGPDPKVVGRPPRSGAHDHRESPRVVMSQPHRTWVAPQVRREVLAGVCGD